MIIFGHAKEKSIKRCMKCIYYFIFKRYYKSRYGKFADLPAVKTKASNTPVHVPYYKLLLKSTTFNFW